MQAKKVYEFQTSGKIIKLGNSIIKLKKFKERVKFKFVPLKKEPIYNESEDAIEIFEDFILSDSKINGIPFNLIIHGNLNLNRAEFSVLTHNIKILNSGDSYISNTNSIWFTNSYIEEIRGNLYVEDNAYLGLSLLNKIPENIVIKNTLDIFSCPLALNIRDKILGYIIKTNKTGKIKNIPDVIDDTNKKDLIPIISDIISENQLNNINKIRIK